MSEIFFKEWIKSIRGASSRPHPFNSSSQRSINNSSFTSPGPGAYDVPTKDTQRTSNYRVFKDHKSPINQEFQWMFSKERESCLTLKDNNIMIGPGAYDVKEHNKIMKNSWSKASRFKTTPHSVALDSPGPGYYNYTHKSENFSAAQFVFKSRIKKQLEFTKEKPIVTKNESQKLINTDIELDEKQIEHKEVKRNAQQSFIFASKVPRFFTDNILRNIGPGSYDIDKSSRPRLKTELPRMVRFKTSKSPTMRKKVTSEVGPGSYNMNKYTLSRKLQFKGYPISRQTRFNFSGKKNQSAILPGPGSYMQNKYVYIKQQKFKNPKKSCSKIQIWSQQNIQGSKKVQNLKKYQSSGPGLYNLNAFDIEFRMRKKLQHAQKLKLMEISVPPFNSNVPRP